MKDINFDKEFKNLINTSEDIKVPKKISMGIDDTLNQINRKSKKHLFVKIGTVAAALLLASTIGLGSAFPTLANNLPIINKVIGENSVFNGIFSPKSEYLHFNNLRDIKNHAIAVNKTVGEITVKELAYDGVAFYTVYEVNGNSANTMENIYKYKSSIFVKNVEYTAGVLIPEQLDENTVRVVQVYPIPGDSDIPDEFLSSIRFSKDDKLDDLLEVSLQLNKNQLLASVRKIELNNKIKLGSSTAELLSIIQSPAYASLTIEHGKYEPNKYDFVLLDDEGNELQQVDMGRITKRGLKTVATRVYKASGDTNIAKIVVVEANRKNSYKELNTHSPSSIKTKSYAALDAQLPVSISIGEAKDITVTSIDKDMKSLKIIVNTRDIAVNSFIRMGGISLFDKSQNDDNAYSLSIAEPLGDNNYMLTYYKTADIDFDDTVLCFGDYDELLNVLYEFTAR